MSIRVALTHRSVSGLMPQLQNYLFRNKFVVSKYKMIVSPGLLFAIPWDEHNSCHSLLDEDMSVLKANRRTKFFFWIFCLSFSLVRTLTCGCACIDYLNRSTRMLGLHFYVGFELLSREGLFSRDTTRWFSVALQGSVTVSNRQMFLLVAWFERKHQSRPRASIQRTNYYIMIISRFPVSPFNNNRKN